MKTPTFNPSIQESEAGDLGVRGQPGLQNKFQNRQGYIVRPCLEEKSKQTDKIQPKTQQPPRHVPVPFSLKVLSRDLIQEKYGDL